MGKLGLITSHGPVEVTYPDGSTGRAHTGIQLTDATPFDHAEYKRRFGHFDPTHPANFVGGPWTSREPEVIGSLKDILDVWEKEVMG
jgi:hypothetical protein